MTATFDPDHASQLRRAKDLAEQDLWKYLAVACPAGPLKHLPVQHRDAKPPWCPHCGRTGDGHQISKAAS